MISEEKKRIVIGNCFNVDCNIDTTICEAYELGFDRGMQKVYPVIRRDVLNQVLDIIDDVFMKVSNGLIHTSSEALEETHNRVLALKGEQR